MANDVVLFIDANQYLKLYEMVAGKQLLDWLEEQQAHIFVTAQIVEEVLRNKLRAAQTFLLANQIKGSIPDHILDLTDERTKELRKTIQSAGDELTALATSALSKISLSEDDVSRRLQRLFDKAVSPSPDEMERARDRKERGNPPGKSKNALGDQITWEQLLTFAKASKQLWIVTGDLDYGIEQEKQMILNPFLRRDLIITCNSEVQIHFYKTLAKGLTTFRKNVGVTTDKLPTAAQMEEIEKEEETLPPGQQMYDLPPVYSAPDYRPAALAALGFLSRSTGGGLSSGETGQPWSQITSHEPPKESR
jgi:hypothetical protein